MKNILVLCTGNSARSILAEALLNQQGKGRLRAYSAGSQPKGEPHPAALALLHEQGLDTRVFRSKSWDEFAINDAPKMDIVITVCDSAEGETCPIWPGAPVVSHWGIADPAAVEGEGQKEAFQKAWDQLKQRVDALLELPLEMMGAKALRIALTDIGGRSEGATDKAKARRGEDSGEGNRV
jgi:protein-tyrosine-phosphatase